MSTPTRTIRNLWKIGPKAAWRQMWYIGDTKWGTLVGKDRYGNEFYENLEEELPLRTRWVNYKDHEFDASQIEPGWHAWMSYMTHDAPVKDPVAQKQRVWEPQTHVPNMTMSRAGYRPYSTVKPKITPWMPVAQARE